MIKPGQIWKCKIQDRYWIVEKVTKSGNCCYLREVRDLRKSEFIQIFDGNFSSVSRFVPSSPSDAGLSRSEYQDLMYKLEISEGESPMLCYPCKYMKRESQMRCMDPKCSEYVEREDEKKSLTLSEAVASGHAFKRRDWKGYVLPGSKSLFHREPCNYSRCGHKVVFLTKDYETKDVLMDEVKAFGLKMSQLGYTTQADVGRDGQFTIVGQKRKG
jgi:hypothetical protein